MGISKAKVTVHSDQGGQYTSHEDQVSLKEDGLEGSISGRGNWHANAVACLRMPWHATACHGMPRHPIIHQVRDKSKLIGRRHFLIISSQPSLVPGNGSLESLVLGSGE